MTNAGSGTAYQDWYDAIYLSTDATLAASDTYLPTAEVNAQTPLASGASYGLSRTVWLPAGVTGTRYLIVAADAYNYQGETNEANNTASVALTISNPDLVVTATPAPAVATWGETVTLSWTVKNQGVGAAVGTWYDRVYLSADNQFDPSTDTLVLSVYAGQHAPLDPGAEYTITQQVALPSGLTGAVYYFFVTDATGTQPEAVETNNTASRPLTFSASNLVLSAPVAPATVAWGEHVSLGWTVRNTGSGPATASWYDYVYLSADDQFDPSTDTLITYAYRQNTTPLTNDGTGYTVTRTDVSIPATIGTGARYLFFVADAYNAQAETSESDNIVRVPVQVTAPDLAFDPATSLPTAGVSGAALALSWTVRNAPGAGLATRPSSDLVYLSTESTLNAGATLLASVPRPAGTLAAGASYTLNQTVALPAGLTGTRYLIIVADGYNAQPESDETNNTLVQSLALSAPDLAVSAATVTPNPVGNGSVLTVNYTVTNSGTAPADRPWTERVVLSADNYLGNLDDLVVGTLDWNTALAPGGSLTRSFTYTVPWGLTGRYNVFIRVDTWNAVPESNEVNNAVDFTRVSDTQDNRLEITYADPPANLRVDAVTVPATALTGALLDVAWRTANHGTATTQASSWSDRIWLSPTATFDPATATELGTYLRTGALDAAANYSQLKSVRLPDALAAGTYWVFVQTDVYNQVIEPGAEADNITASLAAVTVALADVPDLVVTAVTAPAAAVIGQPVSVTWTVRNSGAAAATTPRTVAAIRFMRGRGLYRGSPAAVC